jgi:APA family basic amino acid/polyamine antiporter
VLLYYVVANVAAFTQTPPDRRYPRLVQITGAVLCLVLVATLPPSAIVGGLAVLALGVGYRLIRLARQRRMPPPTSPRKGPTP